MHSALVYFAAVVVSFITLLKASESWWSSQGRENFKERTAELWLSLSETQRHTQRSQFLGAITALLDQLYGPKAFSFRAWWRTQVTTTAFYVVALAVIGLKSGIPLSLEMPPWQGFDLSYEVTSKFVTEFRNKIQEQSAAATDENARQVNKKVDEFLQRWVSRVGEYKSSAIRTIHSVGCFIFALMLGGFEAFVGLAISRQLLRDLSDVGSGSNACAVITSEILLYAVLHGAALLLLTAAAIPIGLAALALIGSAFWYVSIKLGVALVSVALWGLDAYAPLWIRVAAAVSSLPVAIVTCGAVGVLLLKWLGWPAQRIVVGLLDRALKAEKGPAAFFTSAVLCLATLIALLLGH